MFRMFNSLLFFLATILSFGMTEVSALVPLKAGWAAYKTLLVNQPILTKSVTSGVIMSISDGITQRVEHKFMVNSTACTDHNWVRTWQTFATGIVWSGPSAHSWYATLEQIMGAIPVSGAVMGLILRIILDALIFSPITIAGFFTVNSFIQAGPRVPIGTVLSQIREKLTTKWRKAVFAAWTFWPAVNVFNFSMIPLKYRVLYANVMALLWTGYLSFVNNQKLKKAA